MRWLPRTLMVLLLFFGLGLEALTSVDAVIVKRRSACSHTMEHGPDKAFSCGRQSILALCWRLVCPLVSASGPNSQSISLNGLQTEVTLFSMRVLQSR